MWHEVARDPVVRVIKQDSHRFWEEPRFGTGLALNGPCGRLLAVGRTSFAVPNIAEPRIATDCTPVRKVEYFGWSILADLNLPPIFQSRMAVNALTIAQNVGLPNSNSQPIP